MKNTIDVFLVGDILQKAKMWFWIGTLVSLIGFVLPWFRNYRNRDWYSGLYMFADRGLYWIVGIFAIYAVLLLGGIQLIGRSHRSAATIALVTLFLMLSNFLVVTVAVVSSLQDNNTRNIDWTIGLLVMFPGLVVMVGSAGAAWVLQTIRYVSSSSESEAEKVELGQFHRTLFNKE